MGSPLVPGTTPPPDPALARTTFMQAVLPASAEAPAGPALWRWRHLYPAALGKDLLAGLTVGLVAIPLALAFAIASGMKPADGLITAILAGIIVSSLGGTKLQIAGPTGAFVVVVADAIARHGIDGLLTTTLLAGIILVLLGVTRLGSVIKFIPYPVITGFTAGIAIIIFTGQIKDVLGLTIAHDEAEFVPKLIGLAQALSTIDGATLALSAIGLAILLLWPRVTTKIPSPIVAMVAMTLLNHLFGATTIGEKFGELPTTLPALQLPELSMAKITEVFSSALTIALLGAIESLLSAVVIDGAADTKHDANQELIAQGVANLCTPLVHGMPCTGAIARTMTNFRSGGQGPMSGIFHSLVVLLAVLIGMPLIAYVPLAALGTILVVVAWNMSEIHHIRELMRGPRSDVLVLFLTLGLTVFVDLIVAVEVGVILASLLFIKRLTELVTVEEVTADTAPTGFQGGTIPPGVQVYTIGGPFFFGVMERFENTLGFTAPGTHTVILRMKMVPAIDATALHGLERVIDKLHAQGKTIYLTGLKEQPYRTLLQAGVIDHIGGEDHIFPRLGDAIRSLGGTWPQGTPPPAPEASP